MDMIFLSEVKVQTRLGVPEWERMVPQTIVLDLEIAMPHSRSCQTDEIDDRLRHGSRSHTRNPEREVIQTG